MMKNLLTSPNVNNFSILRRHGNLEDPGFMKELLKVYVPTTYSDLTS